MNLLSLAIAGLRHYWRTNLAVVAGVAVAVAVLSGALLVGESVRSSLQQLAISRLGRTDFVLSSMNFFREELADGLTACPLITIEASVAHGDSGRRASRVVVYGIDSRFFRFHHLLEKAPENRQARLSPALAAELGAKPGDTVLIRVETHSDIPRESLHGRRETPGKTMRFTAAEVLPAASLGEFSLRPQQGSVRAIFVPLARLQRELEQPGKANTVLFSGRDPSDILKKRFELEDVGIKLRTLESQQKLAVETTSMILNGNLIGAIQAAGQETEKVFTYLANSIRDNDREISYSLVAASDRIPIAGNGAILNAWAARELNAKPGDRLTLAYYVWKESGILATESAMFQVDRVVPMESFAADRNFAPEYPGITEANSIADWDPPFPMDLKKVTKRDEDYWDRYRTTPKVFISLEMAQKLWQSRFGSLTSMRVLGLQDPAEFGAALRARIDPWKQGMKVMNVRQEGLKAARGTTDFGEYFAYFSVFLMVSALLLGGLFFKLGVEQRLREIGLLEAIGYSKPLIRNLFLMEAGLVSVSGAILGLMGAAAYAAFMIFGLKTWWVDAVGTRLIELHISPAPLASGAVAGVLVALLVVFLTLRSLSKATPRGLLMGSSAETARSPGKKAKWTAIVAGVMGLAMTAVPGDGGFFGAGTLLLVAAIAWQRMWLERGVARLDGLWAMGMRSASYRPGRSALSIALVASATFLIVSLTAFRKDRVEVTTDPKSGTGGYTVFAESLLPLYYDPNTKQGKEGLNLSDAEAKALEGVKFAAFRLRPGDDASCLNLYAPGNPRILAPPQSLIESGRFAFAATLSPESNPWKLLEKPFRDGAVPVIADANSMEYVLHKKLGEDIVVDATTRLRLVASLQDSLFQGELLISEGNFLRLFPQEQGYRFFLIDVAPQRAAEVTKTLKEGLADFGFDAQSTAEKLAAYHRVENTYLATFQSLGALGLVLGTIGLAAVLLRNVLERRKELALLRAVGYQPKDLTTLVLAENLLLLVAGLATGTLCAGIAILPALRARGGALPVGLLVLLLIAVFLTGLTASLVAVRTVRRSPLVPALRAE